MNEGFDDCSEMDLFMNEDKSDVVFVVEGQRIPAMKSILSTKSKVFRAMFGGDFKESADKEVVIEDTTFDAFKSFIQFLYCDRLVFKDDNDFQLIEEVCQLSDRYDVNRILEKVDDLLLTIPLNWSDSVTFNWISKIAFDYKLSKIMAKVLAFIDTNFKHFANKDNKELLELNVLTHNHLTEVLANNYRKLSTEYDGRGSQIDSLLNQMQNHTKTCTQCHFFPPMNSYCALCTSRRKNLIRPLPSTLRTPPSTLRPTPSTLRPTPSTLRTPPSTLRTPPSTLRTPPSTLRPTPSTLRPPSSYLRSPASLIRPPLNPSSIFRSQRTPASIIRANSYLRPPASYIRPSTSSYSNKKY